MIILLLIALVVVYMFFKQIFYIACGVVGVLLAIIIYLIATRKKR